MIFFAFAGKSSALIEACRRGDASAFDTLVLKHQTRIYNLCLWQLGNADDAEDAAQETFIRAWRSIGKFRGDCAFSTWLHRIAINVTHDRAAQRKAGPTPFSSLLSSGDDEEPDLAERTPDTDAGPAQSTLKVERQNAVRAALAQLAPNHRLVLVLFDIEGHSYEEVAQALQLPMGTVKSRLNRARLALREQLESCRELFED